MIVSEDPREELYKRLPAIMQPFVTWISGIPSKDEKNPMPLTPMKVLIIGVASIFFGFAFIWLAIDSGGVYGVIEYFIGFCFVSGGMRRLDVLIIHQTLHSKVFASKKANKFLGEFLTTILLRTPYDHNKSAHMGHHRSPCDEEDVDVIFLRNAGIAMVDSPIRLYRNVLWISISPIFHLKFFFNRLHANFLGKMQVYRRIMIYIYLLALVSLVFKFGNGVTVLLYWIIPLVFGFQISNFLYTATKHRWWLFSNQTIKDKHKRDLLSYARVCCSIAPTNKNWLRWWLEALFVHVPTRLFIIVGDTVQHDLHHVAPSCDWPNSAYERQHLLALSPERFTEVWGGFLSHLKECNIRSSGNA